MIFEFQINRPHIYFLPHVFVIIVIIFQCAYVNFVDLWTRKAASSKIQESLEEARLELVIAAVIVVFTLMQSFLTEPIIVTVSIINTGLTYHGMLVSGGL